MATVGLTPKFDKGASEVMRALATGEAGSLEEALEFQREAFKAQFGCYPEELEPVPADEANGEPSA